MFLNLAHTRLDVFNQTQNLAVECYRITKYFPLEKKYALVQQLRRAAVSVHLNVAEGCSRKSETERKRFFEISRGSVIELDAAVGIAYKLKYCEISEVEKLGELIVNSFKQLSAIISH